MMSEEEWRKLLSQINLTTAKDRIAELEKRIRVDKREILALKIIYRALKVMFKTQKTNNNNQKQKEDEYEEESLVVSRDGQFIRKEHKNENPK